MDLLSTRALIYDLVTSDIKGVTSNNKKYGESNQATLQGGKPVQPLRECDAAQMDHQCH